MMKTKGTTLKKKTIVLVALVLVASLNAQGQRRARPKPKLPAPVASLSIEVALIYKSGDVKPVARTIFVLLDEDLNIILKPFVNILDVNAPLTAALLGPELGFLKTFGDSNSDKAFGKYSSAELRAMREQILAAVATHTVASATTDFTGKATFQGLTPGKRFLYGYFDVGRSPASWHMPLEVKSGTNPPLILSNDNAL